MDQEAAAQYRGQASPLLASRGKHNPPQPPTPPTHSTEPMLLLDMDENGKFVASKRALKFLSEIDTPLAVVSVVGPYRTGKSFLLNRLGGQQRGFTLGPSTNPCTKGIWVWGQPIRVSESLSVLLLDTEGLRKLLLRLFL